MIKCVLGFEAKPRNMYFSLAAPIERCKRLSRLTFEVRHFDQIHTRGNDGGERCRAVEILSCRERDFTRSGQLSASPRDLAHPLNTHAKAAEYKIGVTCIVLNGGPLWRSILPRICVASAVWMMPVHAGWMERTLDRASRSAGSSGIDGCCKSIETD